MLAAGQKYHHSDFYECLKFESGFVFLAQGALGPRASLRNASAPDQRLFSPVSPRLVAGRQVQG